jgi:hypothetical protein
MSTNEIKKSRIKKITIKRKRTSFEKKKRRERTTWNFELKGKIEKK